MWKILCLLCLLIVVGCSRVSGPKTVEASGIVTLDGVPVEGAQITFIDANGSNPAVGTSDPQGRFSLKYNSEKKGAIPGTYQVQVSKTLLEANEGGGDQITISHGLPKKYSNIATSGLTQTIPDSGIKDIELKLQNQ